MTVDLNKILARDDYKRMTENLKSVVEEVAEKIRMKMDELDIDGGDDFDSGEIGADGIVVRVISVSSNCGYTKRFLGIKRYPEEYGHAYYASLEDINDTYYYTGDFHARIYGATNKEALAFLNVAKKLIEGLGELEQKQADEIQQTIDNYRNK